MEVLTGKALSVWLEFIDETAENVFCSQMQIKLKCCVTFLAELFIKKSLKLNLIVFYAEWLWKQREFTTPFDEISPN